MISVIDKTLQSYIGPNAFLFLNFFFKNISIKRLESFEFEHKFCYYSLETACNYIGDIDAGSDLTVFSPSRCSITDALMHLYQGDLQDITGVIAVLLRQFVPSVRQDLC